MFAVGSAAARFGMLRSSTQLDNRCTVRLIRLGLPDACIAQQKPRIRVLVAHCAIVLPACPSLPLLIVTADP